MLCEVTVFVFRAEEEDGKTLHTLVLFPFFFSFLIYKYPTVYLS